MWVPCSSLARNPCCGFGGGRRRGAGAVRRLVLRGGWLAGVADGGWWAVPVLCQPSSRDSLVALRCGDRGCGVPEVGAGSTRRSGAPWTGHPQHLRRSRAAGLPQGWRRQAFCSTSTLNSFLQSKQSYQLQPTSTNALPPAGLEVAGFLFNQQFRALPRLRAPSFKEGGAAAAAVSAAVSAGKVRLLGVWIGLGSFGVQPLQLVIAIQAARADACAVGVTSGGGLDERRGPACRCSRRRRLKAPAGTAADSTPRRAACRCRLGWACVRYTWLLHARCLERAAAA